MDSKVETREFLASRRARITPEQAGLPVYGGNRRVDGLRREEVALFVGVSVDYYTRLERGDLAGASDSVLAAMARAAARRGRTRVDFLGANRLGAALYAPLLESPSPAARRRTDHSHGPPRVPHRPRSRVRRDRRGRRARRGRRREGPAASPGTRLHRGTAGRRPRPRGRTRQGLDRDVRFVEADHTPGNALDDTLDSAYAAKYGQWPGPVERITSAEARQTTLRLDPT